MSCPVNFCTLKFPPRYSLSTGHKCRNSAESFKQSHVQETLFQVAGSLKKVLIHEVSMDLWKHDVEWERQRASREECVSLKMECCVKEIYCSMRTAV